MKKAIDSNGKQIGLFDGNTIKDNGKVIYWFSDEGVFAPFEYSDEDLQSFNKRQSVFIGRYVGNRCLAGDEVIFEII